MSYHIVCIDSDCSLSCKDGQIVCRINGAPFRTLPLEDVGSVIITGFSTTIHTQLLREAAKCGVSIVICENFKPLSILLPANRSTDTLLTRAQISLKKQSREALWRSTIDAKCTNQLALAMLLDPRHGSIQTLAAVSCGKHPTKEAICAKTYWKIYGDALGIPNFTRERDKDGINALLNYGYAVLLSIVLQKLFGVGLDPTFGIGHAIRERSTPLAYDMMEPFRICVDMRVAQWVRDHSDPNDWSVSRDFRLWITQFPLDIVESSGKSVEVQAAIEEMVRTFRKALVQNNLALYLPWTPANLKWAGY